jgi:ArsR family transcriptional regulator
MLTKALPGCYSGCVKSTECRPLRKPKRDYSRQADFFKSFSDPQRLRIFATIAHSAEPVCVCDLTSEIPLLQPTVSHHLRVLKDAGLIVGDRRATWVYYRLAPGAVERFAAALDAVFPQLQSRPFLRKIG